VNKRVAPCFMCVKRRPRKLTASRDGTYYTNAKDVVMFCSLRCAANYGLLWGTPEIENNFHFCPVTEEWETIGRNECHKCNGETE
jgi:hypothetical protein